MKIGCWRVLKMHLFLLISLFLVTCYGEYQDDDWIDPTDMLNYDAAAGRMKHHKQYHTGKTALSEYSNEQAQGTCQSDHLDCKTEANNWKQKDCIEDFSEKEVTVMKDEGLCQEYKENMDTLKKEIEEWRKKGGIPQNTCNPVFRRFLYRIINEARLLGLPDESQPEVHYDAQLVLTKQMVAEFLRFLEDTDWNAGPLDEALGETLVRFRHHNEEEWSWKFEDYLGIDPFSAFMISLSLLCIVMVVATELWTHVGWFTQIRRLLGLCFLVSIVWNWMYLYRDAFAERQAKLTKIENDNSCGKKMTWSENLFDWWKSSSSFQNDPCEEYFKALMVNPILLVPPTKAFAVTFTNFITEPLKHIGKGMGEFFHALLAEMPLFYQPFVLIIIAALLLVFCYGFGTNVHHMNLFPRIRDGERERLLPPNPQREGYDRFIEGGNDRFYNNPQPIQPRQVDNYRDVSNRRPEALPPVDCTDVSNSQPKFIESISASQQPQRKPLALEKGINGQHIRDESSGQLQKKDDSLDQRHLRQQPVKQLLEESPLGSQYQWEESIKDNKPLDKISHIHQDFSGSHAEIKENQLSDGETLENKSQSSGKVKVRKESTEEEKDQLLIKRDGPQEHVRNGHLVVEDIYTDPGNEEQAESSLSFVILEKERLQDEMLVKQTLTS
ncbi:chloride channel CLIC-like protein 1 isoform X3 [Aquarana catesbeiana]|uniref:chloride channel CLIC-like protein 1 isoform X3 n=1 Tax=Aquarana catesbeiana TaxID=8400 RepID=UPI003CC996BD